MALTQVTGPYPIFTDLDGTPLDDGYLYIGEINEDPQTNPIQVYWDSALTIVATQPIRTSNGYAYRNGSPALLYTAGEFSITIRNKRQEFVLYSPLGYGFDPAAVSGSVVKNDFVGNGSTVNFTLSATPSTVLATNVFINGVYQEKDSYSLLGNVVTFSIAPPLSSSIEIMTTETGVINSGNANNISYTATFPGASAQTVQTKLEQYVSVKDFGAVGDGVADDSAAVQAAVNYCLSQTPASTLVITGNCRLGSSVNINRLVDSTTAPFRIIGGSDGSGFYTSGNVTMFDTTLPVTTAPQSENIWFENINFSTSSNANNSFVLAGGKFLRMRFDGCDFSLIRCMYTTTIYAQSYQFYGCRARYWLDYFFSSAGAYDFYASVDMKGGVHGFRFLSATYPILRASIENGVFEGCTGSYVTGGKANGLVVSNNYIEFNAAPAVNLDAGFANTSASVTGNIFVQAAAELADANFYDVQWGETIRATSSGNYCNGKLHNPYKITGADKLLTIDGDVADVELYKGFKTGLFDQNRNAVGNVSLTANNRQTLSIGNGWVGLDPAFGGINIGPGVVQAGAYVPVRIISGTQNPGTNNAFYGNPYWTVGSIVNNSAPVVGQPKGWTCTVSGQPGTWVSLGNL